jgi:hypothetical protein
LTSITNTRPHGLASTEREVYDWCEANGITEWLPPASTFRVAGDQLTYTSFVWNDGVERGFNSNMACNVDAGLPKRVQAIARVSGIDCSHTAEPILDERTVPLRAPVTPRIRELFTQASLRLIEQ